MIEIVWLIYPQRLRKPKKKAKRGFIPSSGRVAKKRFWQTVNV